ncbi:hypothetical protein EVAR_68817_1 [Eumeta japonica]|uniref:Uncharacterized protein n=1 Tax=Eumeta variegata TaxID=151549 RepID=A0A4C1YXK0_EUMVA|nr:hypothetical protein EVAR_68817_1 [Eumeta japonica]
MSHQRVVDDHRRPRTLALEYSPRKRLRIDQPSGNMREIGSSFKPKVHWEFRITSPKTLTNHLRNAGCITMFRFAVEARDD